MIDKIINWLEKDSYYIGFDDDGPQYTVTRAQIGAAIILSAMTFGILFCVGVIAYRYSS
jgi:hypothetical protein